MLRQVSLKVCIMLLLQGAGPHQRRQQLVLPHHHRVHRVLQHCSGPHGSHEGEYDKNDILIFSNDITFLMPIFTA